MLLQFAEGFSSPPHIHNITYRAIVIVDEIHNDDPDAANMWMGPGTFWTQPAGEVHITSAKPGIGGTGFLEILEGPYLVQPSDMSFDNGEKPLHLASSNMVWMGPDEMEWIESDDKDSGIHVSLLWGELTSGVLSGSMIKFSDNFNRALETSEGDLRAVVIRGEIAHSVPEVSDRMSVVPGGYFSFLGGVSHSLACLSDDDCLIYLRTEGSFRLE